MVHPVMNQGLSQIVQRLPSPLSVYDNEVPHYGGMMLVKNNDPDDAKPQRIGLTYCRLYRDAELTLGLRVLEYVYQAVAAGQAELLEERKEFGPSPYIYIAWAERVTTTPDLAEIPNKLKLTHPDIDAQARKELSCPTP
jgi:hypothetical protein